MTADNPNPKQRKGKAITGLVAAGVVFAMVGASFAAVPLYRLFCQATGYGGTTQRADAAPDHVLDRVITVRFDANIAKTLGWDFAPEQREVRVRVGEPTQIAYRAHNKNDVSTTGSAIFNVTPEVAGGYFNKIACFCFTEQTLKAGESVDMPVLFFVDPSIADDHTLDGIDTITLSYTFYPVDKPDQPVAAAEPAPAPGG